MITYPVIFWSRFLQSGICPWILADGFWDDDGCWDDFDFWDDGPIYTPAILGDAIGFWSPYFANDTNFTGLSELVGLGLSDMMLGDGAVSVRTPTYLNWTGDNYFFVPDRSGYITNAVDDPATGNFRVETKFYPLVAAAGGQQAIVSKWVNAGNNRSFYLSVGATGNLNAAYSEDGTFSFANVASSSGLDLIPNPEPTVRVWRSGTNVTFEYLVGDDTWVDFTETGSISIGAGLHSGTTATWEIASRDNGTLLPYSGYVYHVLIDDINTSGRLLTFDADTMNTSGDTSWSIFRNGSGQQLTHVDRKTIQFDSSRYSVAQIDNHNLINFQTGDSYTFCMLTRIYNNYNSFGTIFDKRQDDPTNRTGYLVVYSGISNTFYMQTVDDTLNNDFTSTVGDVSLQSGAITMFGAMRSGINNRMARFVNGNHDVWREDTSADNNGNAQSTENLYLFASPQTNISIPPTDADFYGFAIFNKVLTESELASCRQDMINVITGDVDATYYWQV